VPGLDLVRLYLIQPSPQQIGFLIGWMVGRAVIRAVADERQRSSGSTPALGGLGR
jgi:hypothetical protein